MGCGASSAQRDRRGHPAAKKKAAKRVGKRAEILIEHEALDDDTMTPHEKYVRKMRRFREWFDEADVDRTNSLSVAELREMFQKHGASDEYVLKWLSMYDEDDSGNITWSEFIEAMDKQEKMNVGVIAAQKAEAEREKKRQAYDEWFVAHQKIRSGKPELVKVKIEDAQKYCIDNSTMSLAEATICIDDIWSQERFEGAVTLDELYKPLMAAVAEQNLKVKRHEYRKIVKDFARDFKKMDTDGDGELSKDEIRESILNSNNHKELNKAMIAVSKLLKADVSGDGTISWHEFLAYMEQAFDVDDPSNVQKITTIYGPHHLRHYNDKLKQYRIFFLQADKDGNGVLNKKEVKKMLKIVGSLGGSTSEYLRQWDTDGDGMISWDEFLRSMDSSAKMVVVPNQDSAVTEFFKDYYDLSKPDKVKVKFYHLEAYFTHVERVKDKKKVENLSQRVFQTLGSSDYLGTVPYANLFILLLKRRNEQELHRNKKKYERQLTDFTKKFKKADVDGDGRISREELAEMLNNKDSSQSLEQAAAAAAKLIGTLDKDGSGSITWDEFQVYMEQRAKKEKDKKKKGKRKSRKSKIS